MYINKHIIQYLEMRQRVHYSRVYQDYSKRRSTIAGIKINNYLDSQLETITQWSHNKLILLLGCGSYKPFFFTKYDSHVIGLDISFEMLGIFSRKYPGTPIVQASAYALPFKDQAIRSVLARGSLHHLPALLNALTELRRTLVAGGTVVFLEPFDDWIVWRTIRKIIYSISNSLDSQSEQTLRHNYLITLLAASGLELVAHKSSGLCTFLFLRNDDISFISKIGTSQHMFPVIFWLCIKLDTMFEILFSKMTWLFPELVGLIIKPLSK